MPSLPVAISSFNTPFSGLNGSKTANVSRLKCMKFATTVGVSHYTPTFGRTTTALALSAYRAMAIRCAIDFGYPQLRLRSEFRDLEGSEKSNISFWIGMTFAAITAADFLKVPRTIHAQKKHGLVKQNPRSKRLADLVGKDASSRWHVVEAKAIRRTPTASDLAKWKTQATSIASINGAPVATHSYCCTRTLVSLRTTLVDPPPSNDQTRNLRINDSDVGSGYYQPFLDFLRGTEPTSIGNRRVRLRVVGVEPTSQEYLYLGLDENAALSAEGSNVPGELPEYDDDNLYIGTDGVAVYTSKGPCDLQ